MIFFFFFFFSSRRRHTRSLRDWSSDVCSSDLDVDQQALEVVSRQIVRERDRPQHAGFGDDLSAVAQTQDELALFCFFLYKGDDRALGGDGAGPHAILVSESAG